MAKIDRLEIELEIKDYDNIMLKLDNIIKKLEEIYSIDKNKILRSDGKEYSEETKIAMYDVEKNFNSHKMDDEQIKQSKEIRAAYIELANTINKLKDSREKSLALTNLEQSLFWCNASISRN